MISSTRHVPGSPAYYLLHSGATGVVNHGGQVIDGGGLAGRTENFKLTNSDVTGTITSSSNVGNFAGSATHVTTSNLQY